MKSMKFITSMVLAVATVGVYAVQEVEIGAYGDDIGQANFADFKLTMDNDVSLLRERKRGRVRLVGLALFHRQHTYCLLLHTFSGKTVSSAKARQDRPRLLALSQPRLRALSQPRLRPLSQLRLRLSSHQSL